LKNSREKKLTIWEHIEELKQRLKVIAISLAVTTAFFLLFPSNPLELLRNPRSLLSGLYRPMVSDVLVWMKNYIAPHGLQIISLEIGAPLEIWAFASFLLGLLVSSPIIAYEIYKFIDPALYPNERGVVYPFVIGFTLLFTFGAAFGLFILAPFVSYTVILFSSFVGSIPTISVFDFYTMVFAIVGFSGFGFTFSLIFVLLVRFGIVGTSLVTHNRRYFYLAMFIVTSIITPDGGPLADFALFIPVMFLWEISILFAKRYEKQREAKQAAAETPATATTIKCKFCGHGVEPSEMFCPNCGKSQL